MKKIKAVLSVAMAAALCCTCLAACGREDGGRATAETGELVIRIVDKGYGTEWLEQIAAAYEEANEGCTVEIKKSNDSSSAAARAQSASNDADILISTDSLWSLQNDGYLYDIREVYDSVQEGEDAALKDRMNQSFREYFETDEGSFYQMSWVEAYAGYLYNKDLLDEVYGEDNYSLPNTTDELIAMCVDLATKTAGGQKIEPIALSTAQSYYDLIKYTWFAQYLGEEKYTNLLRGYYENDAGEYVPCETVEEFREMIDAEGRIKVYEVIQDLVVNYAHSESDRMSYTDSQNAFIGLGYGTNYTKCAFYLIGDWFFNEMAASLQNSGADIRYMKTVVLSDMVDNLENSSMTDAQLSDFIDCVDAGMNYTEAAAETGVSISESDYARIAEARSMSYSPGTYHVLGVPRLRSGGAQYALAIKFLKYLVSDEAQAIFIQAQNGLTMPYGYTLADAEAEYGYVPNTIAQSIADAKGDDMIVIDTGSNSLFARSFSLYTGYYERDARNGISPEAAIASTDGNYNPENCIALIVK